MASLGGSKVVRVGFSFRKKKNFFSAKFLEHARSRGVTFLEVKQGIPLVEQGPFDIILHKRNDSDWFRDMEDYKSQHPHVELIEPAEGVLALDNREHQLRAAQLLDLKEFHGKVVTPKQVRIESHTPTKSIRRMLAEAGISVPFIVKPLANSIDGSHDLQIVYRMEGVDQLRPPLLLQEFVDHGGVCFKLYVIGKSFTCVRRRSVPDIGEIASDDPDAQPLLGAIRPLPKLSSIPVEQGDMVNDSVRNPEPEFLERLSAELTRCLKLRLFNVDLLPEGGTNGDRFVLIDVNYFPGYNKNPGYEVPFIDFILEVAAEVNRRKVTLM
ncbi:hypothetical protein CBR_g54337 [Chara braunii]|uniref:Inositol-tetrakisphosphate 1-kinase n=1 Tax=Chara braunii TaxID=69332 RepID=A0A388MC82_CHABU|nr:hypothetical protein CBR_g54337 [Chara braunii]|eukprot:GBG92082.1 hypothetical protein CBR_g54337 [Chara braunii]